MAKFVTIPQIAVTQKRVGGDFIRTVRLQGELVYQSEHYKPAIVIEAGFVSDGASVPQLFWNRYPPFGQYLESAIVHDYFCDLGKDGASPIDYKTAALIFREAMIAQGVSRWKRNVMYQAVRWFGPKFSANPVQ